jgi:hypothetical protein
MDADRLPRLMRRWAWGVLISLAALPLFAQGRRPPWPAASVNTVVDGNVRRGVQVFTIEENPCLSLRTIKQVFGGRVQWKRVSRRIVYLSEGRTAEFTLDVSTAVVGGKALPLSTPPRAWGNDVFLPVSLLVTPEFQSLVASQIQWNAGGKNLTVDPLPAVSSPRFYSYPHKSRLTIDIGPMSDALIKEPVVTL